MVIVAVLWVCAIIMWFALQIAAETRLQDEEQVHLFRKSQAVHLAIGGSYEALGHMAQANSLGFDRSDVLNSVKHKGDRKDPENDAWLPDGEPHIVNYHTGQALVIIEDESEKVNVNMANSDQLKAVALKAGLNDADAERLSDVILDFIDKDDLVRLHGMEKDQYRDLGLPYGPFNGPLTSLDQLLLIPGITQQLFYGFGRKTDSEGQNSDTPTVPGLPAKYSLFRMLTVYGKNVTLKDDDQKDQLDDLTQKQVSWQKGGTYRILSCGRTLNGPPTVILWLEIRYTPDTPTGYQVLYRKLL